MLIYEIEGFLEVESKDIKQLSRSTAAVYLGDSELEYSAVHAVLCSDLHNSKLRCRVAFYSKTLKKAFVFSVKGSESHDPWQGGEKVLTQLGFQLEEVNLNLSAAMLEVVLRDVPGLLAPAKARKLRGEKSTWLAELQSSCDSDPDSVQGKKAALKLNAEKRINEQSEELRQLMEALFATQENANAELDALVSKMKDLTSRLEAAEARVESERNQREMSESITAAAEKRIQELEEVLVDAETTLSKTIKQTQKSTQLQKRVKKVEGELKASAAELERECERQGQLVEENRRANERISFLEAEQEEACAATEKMQAELAEEQSKSSRLIEALEKAESQVESLGSELKDYQEKADGQHAETEKALTDVQVQLEGAQQALKESLDLKSALEEQLVAAIEENAESKERLRVAEKNVDDKCRDDEQLLALRGENEKLSIELKELHEKYSQELSCRKRLEKEVSGEGKRIKELEAALAEESSASRSSPEKKRSVEDDREITSLKTELDELNQRMLVEHQSRQDLEVEVDEAHKLIDSLEKMLRENDSASKEKHSRETSKESRNKREQELEDKVNALEGQLEQKLAEQKKLAKAFSAAEKKLVEQAEELEQKQAAVVEQEPHEVEASEAGNKSLAKPAKPLPHELRPAPKKGAFFHPDWDLEGLPCKSDKGVYKAWEAAFNVQISLEGYPSQYCAVFLVVLSQKREKRLFMLYHLKSSKHTLVCVPAKAPKDEASLKKAIKEGLNFLKLSGFEMDEMKRENIASTLKNYFLKG